MGIQNTTAKRKQHAHSDVIVKQYNIMSTQVVSGCHVRGETEIPESSSKLRHGHLRLDSIHTLRHHPETKTMFHWPLFLISLHIGRGCHTNKTTDTTPLHKLDELLIFQAQCSRQKLWKRGNQQTRCQPLRMSCTTLGSLTAPVTDIATHCSADRPVGRPQRIPHRCTPLRGTGSQPQEFCRWLLLS